MIRIDFFIELFRRQKRTENIGNEKEDMQKFTLILTAKPGSALLFYFDGKARIRTVVLI
jgi:hypothetical protein